jgi:hypothetical protein
MKKIVISLTATVLAVTNTFCQSNNPHNQVGIDVVNVAKQVYQDYESGKIKDITQNTLDYYFKNYLPHYQQPSLDNFNIVFDVLKKADNTSIIKNAEFSEQGTAFLKKTLENYSITKLVDEVNQSKLPEAEKENILCVLAINYNLIKPNETKSYTPSSGKGPNNLTDFSERDYFQNKALSNGLPTLLWGGLGYITGTAICGLPCGIIGGAIGLVLGGWANDRTQINPSGSFGYGNSGSGSSSGSNWGPQP